MLQSECRSIKHSASKRKEELLCELHREQSSPGGILQGAVRAIGASKQLLHWQVDVFVRRKTNVEFAKGMGMKISVHFGECFKPAQAEKTAKCGIKKQSTDRRMDGTTYMEKVLI